MIYIYNFSTHCTIHRLSQLVPRNKMQPFCSTTLFLPLKIILGFLLISALIMKLVPWRTEERQTEVHTHTQPRCSTWGPNIRTLWLGGCCHITHAVSGTYSFGLPAQWCLEQAVESRIEARQIQPHVRGKRNYTQHHKAKGG